MESKKTLPDKTDIKTSLQEQGPTNEVPFEDGPLDTRSVCMSMDNGVRSWYRRVQCATTGRLSTRPKKGNILFQRWIYPEKCWLIVSKESIPAEIVKCLSTVDPVPTYWMEKELKEVAQEKSVIEKAPKDMTGVVCVGSEYVRRIQYRCGSIHYQIWSTDSKTSRWLECSGKKLSAVVRASLKHIEPVMSEQLKIKLTRAKAKLAKAIPSKGNIYRIVAKIGDSAGDYRLIYYPKERVFKTQILGADGRTWLPCGKNKPIAVVKYLNAEKKEYMLALKQ